MASLFKYVKDRVRYRNVCEQLLWYRKYKRLGWVKGENFGDYLSLIVVGEITRKKRLKSVKPGRLLAIGSIFHFAKDGDVIWGSGINGKIAIERHNFIDLDIRMVRGPLTRNFLIKKGLTVPEIYGDPALLLPLLFPQFKPNPQSGKIIVLPNLNELNVCRRMAPKGMRLVSPFKYWKDILNEILTSELVLTSSLHGVIISEAFGVPVRLVKPLSGETLFKYHDYYRGTGRELTCDPSTFKDTITASSGLAMPTPKFDAKTMLKVFPWDLFS